ncbi:MAG: hypothetical protein R2865_01115 [Deinococcales bacterium]
MLNIETLEREIDRSELYIADELFFCGTGAQITPIAQVDKRFVGDGTVGKLTKCLRDCFFSIVQGKNTQYEAWTTRVDIG